METRTLADIMSDLAIIMHDIDAASGEVDDGISETLSAVEGELADKVSSILSLAVSLDGAAGAEKERAKKIADHASVMSRRAERLRSWVTGEIESMGLEKYDAGTFKLTKRLNPPRVEITDEPSAKSWLELHLPSAVKTQVSLDKREILNEIKSGSQIPGVEAVRGTSWRIQ